jgi:hypothetical protein
MLFDLDNINPNLNFETPHNFKKKLHDYINNTFEKKRPNTAKTINKGKKKLTWD